LSHEKSKTESGRRCPVECPVLLIALRVSELWDAHSGAEARECDERKADEKIAEQIAQMRYAFEKTASFAQARSLGGAVFQIALALDAARDLYDPIPSDEKDSEAINKIERLLDSVATTLGDTMGPGLRSGQRSGRLLHGRLTRVPPTELAQRDPGDGPRVAGQRSG
jgi:hypothetical protein